MRWKFTKDNQFPDDGERVLCVFYENSNVEFLIFSSGQMSLDHRFVRQTDEKEFTRYQVRAWVKEKYVYYDFMDKAILDQPWTEI